MSNTKIISTFLSYFVVVLLSVFYINYLICFVFIELQKIQNKYKEEKGFKSE